MPSSKTLVSPTEQDENDTKNDQFDPNKTKAIQDKNSKKVHVNETQYNFTIINTETDYYKYTLSKQLEEIATSKRYNGKHIYYIKQMILLFERDNRIIAQLKMCIKKNKLF